jgi:hypothetical protein
LVLWPDGKAHKEEIWDDSLIPSCHALSPEPLRENNVVC